MDKIAEAEGQVNTLTGTLGDLEAAWRIEQAELEAAAEKERTQIAGLAEKRRITAAGIDPAAVAIYESVRQQKGRAVARCEQGACRSCGLTLSSAQRQQVRGDDLMRCPNCGRILFNA
jgi:predicted  nucleic acid-binding Zn-ribbon protein